MSSLGRCWPVSQNAGEAVVIGWINLIRWLGFLIERPDELQHSAEPGLECADEAPIQNKAELVEYCNRWTSDHPTFFSFNRRSAIAAFNCLSISPACTASMIVSMIFGSLSNVPISIVLLSPVMARGYEGKFVLTPSRHDPSIKSSVSILTIFEIWLSG
jgi:hypothetical protein